MPGLAPAVSSTRRVARRAWRGLLQVLAAPDAAPAWWHPPWPRRAYVALGVTTVVLGVVNLTSIHPQPTATPAPPSTCRASPCYFLHYPPLGIGQLLLVAAVVTPLLLAARYPLLGWRLCWLALLLAPLVPAVWRGGWPWGPAQLLVLLAVFCVAGVRYRRPVLWWMWALSLIPWWLWLLTDRVDLTGPLAATIVFTVATIALDSLSSRWRAQRALAAQTERAELERARRAVLEERTRIARELHDVVAHHMSLIAVRAETAPYRLSDLPESARAEFGSLSDVAREALTEMRRLLGVLRDDRPAGLAPQPRLSDLPALVHAARQAGIPVELSLLRSLDQVPSGVALCAYRIVQESLSNAGQHAPGAAVTVSVDQDGSAVLLRVANGPGGPASLSQGEHGPGHGLTGMRERVAMLGGSLVGRPGTRRRLRGRRSPPAWPGGMTVGCAPDGGVGTRCLIADDQAMVREGFAAVLNAQPGLQVVGQAADGADAVRQTRHLEPDVVLMDVRMPIMDGLEATRQILRPAADPERPRVLMLTTFDLDDYVYQALRAGASGFLLKDATAAELVHAVRVVAAGDALLAPSVTRRLIADFARRHTRIRCCPPPWAR